MAGHVAPEQYSNLTAFLATAGVVVPIAKRFKISPVLGFLGAGVLLGPQGLGRLVGQFPVLDYITVTQPANISGLAEFGVVFLLFTIGLELSWERLWLMRRTVFGLGGLFTLACGAAGAAAALAFGQSPVAAVAIGAALAMSSTAVTMPVLGEAGRLQAPAGRTAFAVLLFQDLAVAPILVVLALVGGGGASGANPLLDLGVAAVGLALSVVAGRLLLRPLFRSAARARSPELFTAASLLVVIGASLVAGTLGLSMALGAFVAGVLLAETEFRHEIEVLIDPFKGLLLGLFFLSVGVGLNLKLLVEQPLAILAVLGALIVAKSLIGVLGSRMFGLGWGGALETGLALGAGGEFAFVILADASGSRVLAPAVAQALVVSATLSLFAIPLLARLGERLNRRPEDEVEALAPQPAGAHGDEPPRVLVVGFGRVGHVVADLLDQHQIAWIGVERDARLVKTARDKARPVFFGDAGRPELLDRCGLAEAPAVVVTMDAPDSVEAVVKAVRSRRSDVVLVARARDARQARRLYQLGATDAVPETVEASLQLAEALLVDMGVPMGLVIASIHEKRDQVRRALIEAKAESAAT